MSTNPKVPPFEPGPPGPLEPAAYDPPLDSPAKTPPDVNAVKFTRAAALWSSLIIGLGPDRPPVFITQNTESVEMTFIAWHWRLPLGVQILLSAVLGSLLTVLVGAARIVQLRRAAKKNYKAA
jgi:uncharacterized integral membrane protein